MALDRSAVFRRRRARSVLKIRSILPAENAVLVQIALNVRFGPAGREDWEEILPKNPQVAGMPCEVELGFLLDSWEISRRQSRAYFRSNPL